MRHRTLKVFLALTCLSWAIPQAALGQGRADNWVNSPQIVPPHAKYAGKTYGEHLQDFWHWTFSFPNEEGLTHPLYDVDGSSMHVNQEGPVYYLSKTWVGADQQHRFIDVPAGTALFAPLNGWIGFPNPDSPEDRFDPEWMENRIWEVTEESTFNFRLAIDGVEIRDVNAIKTPDSPYFANTGPFSTEFPDNSAMAGVLGVDPAEYPTPNELFPVVNMDFMAMIKPLPVGEHTVELLGQTWRGGGADPVFTTDIVYHVNVLPAGGAAAVPEPSTILLSTMALGLMGTLRRRRGRAALQK
jgi:hypothetical protein